MTYRGRLAAFDEALSDAYGGSVALSANGLVMAVGAFAWEGTVTNQGVAYIYDWLGGTWAPRGSVLVSPAPVFAAYYGKSVALSSDGLVLAVGVDRWGTITDDRGGVYIYDWSGSAWVQRGDVLQASDGAAGDYFGKVAFANNGLTLVVGAQGWEDGATSGIGGVYIYDWSGSAWVQRGSVLKAADAAASDAFGSGVGISEDGLVLVVGAQGRDGGGYSTKGGVYTFDWSGGAWVQRGSVLAPSEGTGIYFGASASLSGDGASLVVGATYWDGELADQGAAYIYDLSGSSWIQSGSTLTSPAPVASARFGSGVALSGTGGVLAVGAYVDSGSGAVYTWDVLPPAFWTNLFGQREA